ncbi:MAG: imidazolonepropionase-like domain-containing protein [Dysosmobacter sp.]
MAYEGTKIVEIGEEAALRAKYPQAEIIDAKGGVIMPAPHQRPHPHLLRFGPGPFHRRQQPHQLL